MADDTGNLASNAEEKLHESGKAVYVGCEEGDIKREVYLRYIVSSRG